MYNDRQFWVHIISIGSLCGNGNAELFETQIQDLIKAIEPEEYTTTYLNVNLITE